MARGCKPHILSRSKRGNYTVTVPKSANVNIENQTSNWQIESEEISHDTVDVSLHFIK